MVLPLYALHRESQAGCYKFNSWLRLNFLGYNH